VKRWRVFQSIFCSNSDFIFYQGELIGTKITYIEGMGIKELNNVQFFWCFSF